jgi:hypothetical protein
MTSDHARMQHFAVLDRGQQAEAIHRLAALGWSEYDIASACQLAVEQIRRILADHEVRRA